MGQRASRGTVALERMTEYNGFTCVYLTEMYLITSYLISDFNSCVGNFYYFLHLITLNFYHAVYNCISVFQNGISHKTNLQKLITFPGCCKDTSWTQLIPHPATQSWGQCGDIWRQDTIWECTEKRRSEGCAARHHTILLDRRCSEDGTKTPNRRTRTSHNMTSLFPHPW